MFDNLPISVFLFGGERVKIGMFYVYYNILPCQCKSEW